MQYGSLSDFLARGRAVFARGPVAVILSEDGVELAATLRHHLDLGFATVLVLMRRPETLPDHLAGDVIAIRFADFGPDTHVAVMNALIPAAAGQWLYYAYNGEFLFYPFCDTRPVGAMLTFQDEERRASVHCTTIDLYSDDLRRDPGGISLERAHLDTRGYYAHPHAGADEAGPIYDFYGGLRWRFEDHVPWERRRIDRIALFRAAPGLVLQSDHRFNQDSYNSVSCPWHHNVTAAICSFRTAKALCTNPDAAAAIDAFTWRNAARFDWRAQQLLDLGLIEPGQWF